MKRDTSAEKLVRSAFDEVLFKKDECGDIIAYSSHIGGDQYKIAKTRNGRFGVFLLVKEEYQDESICQSYSLLEAKAMIISREWKRALDIREWSDWQ